MKERPILFSAPMVQAILDGKKTQTRRVMKPQPWQLPAAYDRVAGWMWTRTGCGDGEGIEWGSLAPMDKVSVSIGKYCPYGIPGDRLWVRESFKFGCAPNDKPGQGIALFGNDARTAIPHPEMERSRYNWCRIYKPTPSIHMPRWACRITLEITRVRVQPLQDITEADATAEGMETIPVGAATWNNRQSFSVLWDKLNGKRAGSAWDANPWVWVVEFRRVQP